jgi:hypothetical protein
LKLAILSSRVLGRFRTQNVDNPLQKTPGARVIGAHTIWRTGTHAGILILLAREGRPGRPGRLGF